MALSSVVDKVVQRVAPNAMLPDEQQIDAYIKDRLSRSEARMSLITPAINERYEFWRGNHYAYTDSKGKLNFLPTKTTPQGGGKRPWVSRSVQNLLIDIVQHEVSAVTQRIPSYEVTPTSVEPAKRSAARISEQVALYGYDKWNIRGAAVDAVTHAVVGQEGFAWPYFDTTVGPMIRDRNGEGVIGQGEIKIRVYGSQDVMWEPGVRFNDSPWHSVRSAQTMEAVVSTPGFVGGLVKPDVTDTSTVRRGYSKYNTQLVEVYDYLELPTKSFPMGRWLTIANSRIIAAPRPYPTPTGICLFPLSYIQDPDNDRDMGLVQHLLDPQRIYNDAWNKVVEWKNLAINPQLFVAPGVLQGQKITNEPGAVYEIADPANNIKWREVPAMPQELFQIIQESNGVMARLAAQNDIPQQVEAGKAIQTLIERDQARRQAFVAQVAEWHAHVAGACLYLVQQYYTEPRLLQIKGRWSPDVIKDFKGASLQGQIDVRVSPGSIEPRTKAAMEQKVLAFADRGWITPEQAMAAIEGGYAAEMVTSYELDIGRATRIIARLKAGPEALFGTPAAPAPSRTEIDPLTGAPTDVPDFMPRTFDNIAVQKSVFEDWMKTEEFESQERDIQGTAMEIYQAMLRIESDKRAQEAQALQAAAGQAGIASAAQGGTATAMPDAPAASPDSPLPTPNQPADQSRPPQ
jgi:hypothetical protein